MKGDEIDDCGNSDDGDDDNDDAAAGSDDDSLIFEMILKKFTFACSCIVTGMLLSRDYFIILLPTEGARRGSHASSN